MESKSLSATSATLIHTVAGLVPVFGALADELLPTGMRVMNMVDDSLLSISREEGSVSTSTKRRLAGLVWSAADAGADAVMVTCSSMGGAVDDIRPLCRVPLLRVDEAMVEQAITMGKRVGVLATLSTTLSPTVGLIHATALRNSREIEVTDVVCTGAFDAVSKGDVATHDTIVAKELMRLGDEVDVVVLAQASMARVVDNLDQPLPVPVLSSPRAAVERLAGVLYGNASGG